MCYYRADQLYCSGGHHASRRGKRRIWCQRPNPLRFNQLGPNCKGFQRPGLPHSATPAASLQEPQPSFGPDSTGGPPAHGRPARHAPVRGAALPSHARVRRPRRRHPGALRRGQRATGSRSGRSRRAAWTGSPPGRACWSGRRPHAQWFVGGQLNVAANCLDRHLDGPRRNKAAIIWEGEPGDRRVYTYWELAREVGRAANALRRLGVRKGDRVAIYLPMVPEAAIAMLACARIGAVHSVVFGGFSAESLRDRINDATATVLITADGGYRRGQMLPLKRIADEALADCPSIRHVVVVRRGAGGSGDETFAEMTEGRDHWWHRLLDKESPNCPAGADGLRGPALHPLHLGHHREAEGHRPHHRRLPDPGDGHDAATSSTCGKRTSSGAPPTSAGSPDTRTWCTARSPTAPRC